MVTATRRVRLEVVRDGTVLGLSDRGRASVALVRPPLRLPRASYTTLACPPLALAYLAASLRHAGTDVSIVDAVGEAPRRYFRMNDPRFLGLGLTPVEVADRVPTGATLIGVTCMFSESWPIVRETIDAIRVRFPAVPIVVGGEHPTAMPEATLRDGCGVDVVALGEGEETIVELARALEGHSTLEDVPGVAFLRGEELVVTERRPRIRAVDEIPRPAWDLVPMAGYLDNGLAYGIGRQRSMPVLATRGCPFQCTFCSSPQMWTTRWTLRETDAVLDEMEWAIAEWGIDNFDFYDLTAILRKDWILELCEKMKRRGLSVTWQIPSGTRSEALDEDVLPMLRASGVHHVVYAPESGSPSVLRRVKKKVNLDRMKESMAAAVRAGLTVKCNFIVGFPDERFEEAMETVQLCRELARLGVTDVNIGPFCPYPGSELHAQLVESGELGAADDEYFDMLAMYSDLSRSRSWSRHMSDRQMALARVLGMSEFYARAFLHRPARLAELPWNVATGRHRTRLDRALADMMRRFGDSIRVPTA